MEQEKHFGVIVHDWDPEKWQAEEHLWEAWRHCVKKALGGCCDSTAAGSQEDDAAELSWRSSPQILQEQEEGANSVRVAKTEQIQILISGYAGIQLKGATAACR